MNYKDIARELVDVMSVYKNAKMQKVMENALNGEAYALCYLANRGGEHTLPGELGDAMHVTSARIAQTLNSLEGKGLITRNIDSEDRRRILIALTDAGHAEAEEAGHRAVELTGKMLEKLGETDAREYVRIMRKLTEIMDGQEHSK